VLRADSLRVHVIDNRLWYQGTESEPVLYGDMNAFLEDKLVDNYARIRLLGMSCNAELIVGLYDQKRRVEVCTPAIVAQRTNRYKPGPVLFELGLCCWGPSQGGFHEVVASDRAAYALAAYMRTSHTEVDKELVQQHIAWKPLEFLQSVSIANGAAILAKIIDPRWYIDPCYPDRPNRLYEALGLNLHTQRAVTGTKYYKAKYQNICRCVLHSWKDEQQEQAIKGLYELAGTKPHADATLPGIRPHDFCWRTWAGHRDPVKADVRGSQRFANYMRQTWLSEIYRGAASTPEERAGLFRAADFFKYEEEVYAYEQFAAKLS